MSKQSKNPLAEPKIGNGEKLGLDQSQNVEWGKTRIGSYLEWGMGENPEWIPAGMGENPEWILSRMGENPDWIPAGIWNGGKARLDFCWNMEWGETWTGFLLKYGMGENPDWIPAGVWNDKTRSVSALEYGMGENPDCVRVRIQNEEELNQASQTAENWIKVFKAPFPWQQQSFLFPFRCPPALQGHSWGANNCASPHIRVRAEPPAVGKGKGSCGIYKKSKEESGCRKFKS